MGAGRIARQQPQAGERRGLLGRGGLTGAVAQLRLGRRGAAERGAADRLQPGGQPAHRRHHRPALAQLGRALERLERRLRPALGDREPGALHHHRHPQRDVGRVGQQLVRAAEVGERVLAPVALQRDAAERRLGEPDRPRPHPAALARERERLAGQPARPLQPAGDHRMGGEAGDGDEREPVAAAGLGRAAGGLEVAGGGLQRAGPEPRDPEVEQPERPQVGARVGGRAAARRGCSAPARSPRIRARITPAAASPRANWSARSSGTAPARCPARR